MISNEIAALKDLLINQVVSNKKTINLKEKCS